MRTLVVDHPLVAHKLTALRKETTDTPTFRRALSQKPVRCRRRFRPSWPVSRTDAWLSQKKLFVEPAA